ncbi:MAG: hypothetical protein ACI398_06000 [Clostridium sp.]
MKNKIFAISIIGLIFFMGILYVQCRFHNNRNADYSSITSMDRKEMEPLDSLRYKFL